MNRAMRLLGRQILITRPRGQSSALRSLLEKEGAEVLEVPTIQIRPCLSPRLDEALRHLKDYDWIIFTSANAVPIFAGRLRELGLPPPPPPLLCAIGPATAQKLEESGWQVELVPRPYQAEGILDALQQRYGDRLRGMRILLPRASQARQILPRQLRKWGCRVDVIALYETVLPKESAPLLRQALTRHPDAVVFTSSSTVHHFVKLLSSSAAIPHLTCAVIGPITAQTARQYGFRNLIQAGESTVPSLVEALGEYFEGRKGGEPT